MSLPRADVFRPRWGRAGKQFDAPEGRVDIEDGIVEDADLGIWPGGCCGTLLAFKGVGASRRTLRRLGEMLPASVKHGQQVDHGTR